MYAVGLMSGTSLDGIDAALVKIEGAWINTKVELINFITYKIPQDIKAEIKEACSEKLSRVDLICSLNFKLGYLFSEAVKAVCEKANFDIKKLDFIASHGQTIYHIPKEKGNNIRSTLQIGEAAIISYELGITVVSNFRVMDMAAGGQGAPLVPFSEFILFGGQGKNIALQNIGGIGNVTVISAEANIDKVVAFDTGPGNMIIDEVCSVLFGKSYDKDGKIAASGKVNYTLLDHLMEHPYINQPIPKTTGREEFGQQFVKMLLNKYKNISAEDMVATVTMFTAKSIAVNYKNFILNNLMLDRIIIGGGGAHNKTLIAYLKSELPTIEILTQEEIGFSSDAKEAIAFAILGNETLNKNYSNVPSATGAKSKVILGQITNCPYRRDYLE